MVSYSVGQRDCATNHGVLMPPAMRYSTVTILSSRTTGISVALAAVALLLQTAHAQTPAKPPNPILGGWSLNKDLSDHPGNISGRGDDRGGDEGRGGGYGGGRGGFGGGRRRG